MKRSWARTWVLRTGIFGGTAALAVALVAFVARRGPDATARISVVKRGDLMQKVTMAGAVFPRRRTLIVPPYNGYVKKMYVHVGEDVKAGAPLVSVVQNLGVAEEVYPLRAPFAGTVVQVLHDDGEYVDMANPDTNVLVRIDDLGKLYVQANVSELDLPKLRVGQDVIIRAAALPSKTYHGVIREIFDAAREKKGGWDPASDKVEFPVRAEIVDADGAIKPGMSALADAIADKRTKVLTLPLEFVEQEGDKYFVTLESGKRVPVKVGLQNDEAFEVTAGLKEGDRVRQVDFLSAENSD